MHAPQLSPRGLRARVARPPYALLPPQAFLAGLACGLTLPTRARRAGAVQRALALLLVACCGLLAAGLAALLVAALSPREPTTYYI